METNWNLTHIFKNDEAWGHEEVELEKEIHIWEKELNDKLDTTENLYTLVGQKIKIDSMIEKVYCYPRRFLDLNSKDKEKQGMFDTAMRLYSKILELTEIFIKKVIENSQVVDAFLNQYPYYERYIEITCKQIKDANGVILNNIKAVYRSLTETDFCFGEVHNEEKETVTLTRKLFQDLMLSKNAGVRKETLIVYNEAYEKIKNTLAVLMNQKYKEEISCIDSHKSLLEKKLSDDELPSEIVSHLISAANNHLSILKDYTNLKKEFLGFPELHTYDTFLPIGLVSKMEYELEEAISIIKNALSLLGDGYVNKIDKAFLEGWVDVYPKDNKRKMSYSCISYCGVPYASLNYNKSIVSVRTLAHELGHSIHTDYAKKNAFEYFEYHLFLSEVVSKVNEILLNEYLLSLDLPNEEKLYLLNNIISSLGNTLFGQVMNTEFEHTVISKIEESQSLTAKDFSEIYKEIFTKYYGDTILTDVDNSLDWTHIPHFIMNPSYYLYQYSIGVSLAIEISKRIQENKDCFREKYIEFLSIGNTKSIVNSLQVLGINLNDSNYLENAYLYLEKHMNLLKTLKK